MPGVFAIQNTAGSRAPWRRIAIVAVISALVVVAVNVILVHWLAGPANAERNESAQAEERSREAVRSELPLTPSSAADADTRDKITDESADAPHQAYPPATKALAPALPPTVTIKRLEPAEPQEGESLDVSLEADGPESAGLRYQYRVKPGGKWLSAENGRIKLSPLRAGPL